MKKCIAVVAFAVIFLAALFLFMRNYPSDRWFSGVFIVAGGVMAWCVWGAEAEAEAAGEAEAEATEAEATEAEVDGVGVADKVTEVTETVPVETITS